MLKLRPHHLIDIIRNIGQNRPLIPHPYGHAQHTITQAILDGTVHEILLIVGADDICKPCIHLTEEGLCNDILPQLKHTLLKQDYNDKLDHRVLKFLDLKEGSVIQLKDFLHIIETNISGLISVCTHPKEDKRSRRDGIIKGLLLLNRENNILQE
jgi:hypothetical protein